jgi:hypothetical protein
MRTLLSIIVAVGSLVGVARADVDAIAFTVLPVSDLKQILNEQGTNALSNARLEEKAVAHGYAFPGSTVWLKTADFQVRIKIGQSEFTELGAGEYAYEFSWYDQKRGTNVFSLSGKVKPGNTPTLPAKWDQKELAIVFSLENLNQ